MDGIFGNDRWADFEGFREAYAVALDTHNPITCASNGWRWRSARGRSPTRCEVGPSPDADDFTPYRFGDATIRRLEAEQRRSKK